jgi:glycosyltransferase involved in cell wall biosynthesis
MKPRVLLLPDVPDWAYDNICDHIVANHSDRFEFERYYMAGVAGYPEVFLNQVFGIMKPFDILHFFWREDIQHLLNPEAVFKAASRFSRSADALLDAMARPVVTTSVYDHLHLEPQHFAWRSRAFWFADGYSVSSGILDEIYRGIEAFPDPIAVLPDGTDTRRFRPEKLERLTEERPLRIGWVGNPNWGNDPVRDPKGVRTILNPAIEMLKQEGCEVEAHFADTTVQKRTRDEMAEYYGEIDVLVCSSEIEGTPNPVLEAVASGVPVVSTRVGIVPDVLGPKQSRFILAERSPKAMAAALKELARDRAQLAELSEENLARAPAWDWTETAKGWPGFWEAAMARQKEGQRGPLKQYFLRERYLAWYADNVKYANLWQDAGGSRGAGRGKARQAVSDWITRSPRRQEIYDRLRGRR